MTERRTKPCGVPLTVDADGEPDLDGDLCLYHRAPGKVKCSWHWLLRQPIEVQVKAAERRADEAKRLGQHRTRVPSSELPAGERWCAGCQTSVPLFYAQGSRCRACNSRATHASHVKRTYDLDPAEYDALLRWQGGVCFICGQVPRSRRLAVDHDHRTGAVRGLLCANDEYGCNVQLRRLLNSEDVARRALEYVQTPPLTRMRSGEPARARPRRLSTMDLVRPRQAAPVLPALEDWHPW